MKEICIPITVKDGETVEVEVRASESKTVDIFKIDSFPWKTKTMSDSADKITQRRNSINNYDENWELLQIFTPAKNTDRIQVLFRKKK